MQDLLPAPFSFQRYFHQGKAIPTTRSLYGEWLSSPIRLGNICPEALHVEDIEYPQPATTKAPLPAGATKARELCPLSETKMKPPRR